ncbi:MAG: hypothetical protein DMF01_10920, partial [Verrucomicrobia bacterium]
MAVESGWIYSATIQFAAEVDCDDLIKSGGNAPILRVAGAKTPKAAAGRLLAADKKVSVRIHIQSSELNGMRNDNWRHPGDPAISGSAELATAAAGRGVPFLVLKTVPGPVGLINGKPLFIAPTRVSVGLQLRPGLAAVCRAVHVFTK